MDALRVGVANLPSNDTGCTVVLLPPGTVGSVDVAGGAPATRETDLLRPSMTVPGPDAICLCGGSASGLAAADGVLRVLQAAGRGFPAGPVRVPIVPAAAVFDDGARRNTAPGAREGEEAVRQALSRSTPEAPEGRVGAGRSVSVGKVLGPERAMPSGQAAGAVPIPGLGTVGVLVVVNAMGSIRAEDGAILAGPLGPDRRPASTTKLLLEGCTGPAPSPLGATTLAVVVTDVPLGKGALAQLARMAHDGLARAIDPVHTPADGDAVFALSVPRTSAAPSPAPDPGTALTRAGTTAAWLLERAIRRAVRLAALPDPTGLGPA